MAAARDIPLVTVAFSGVLPELARDQVLGDLRPLWQAEGLDDPTWADVYGQLYLHPFPDSFGQRPDSPVVRPVRPDRGSPRATPPGWVAALGADRPFVYVTAGTEPPSVTFPWREVFAAAGGLEVDAVATIGPHVDPAAFGPCPPTSAWNASSRRPICSPSQRRHLSRRRRQRARRSSARPAPTRHPAVRRPVGERRRRRTAGCGIVVRPDGRRVEDLDRSWVQSSPTASQSAAATRVADEISAMPPATTVTLDVEALAAR